MKQKRVKNKILRHQRGHIIMRRQYFSNNGSQITIQSYFVQIGLYINYLSPVNNIIFSLNLTK